MRRSAIASAVLLSLSLPALADDAKAAAKPPAPATAPSAAETEKTLYALGLAVSRNLAMFALSPAEVKIVQEGLADGALGRKPRVELETYGPKLQEFAKSRMSQAAAGEKKAGAAFLEKEAAQPGAKKQPAGFVYRETRAGTGVQPKATDTVKVHYKGTLIDGTLFDSSLEKDPAVFPLNGVIPCWSQGVQLMKVGGSARLVCPSELAYGDTGAPPRIKGGATLVFDVQLLSIESGKPAAMVAPPATKK